MRRLIPLSSSRMPYRAAPPTNAVATISPAYVAIRAAAVSGSVSSMPSSASLIRYGPAIWNRVAKKTSTTPQYSDRRYGRKYGRIARNSPIEPSWYAVAWPAGRGIGSTREQ